MGVLEPLATLAGIEVDDFVARLRRNAIAWSIIGLLALLGLVFLLVTLNAALTTVIGPVWAPASIAGVALVLAVVIFVSVKLADAAAARREAERRKTMERTALATTAVMTALPMALRLDIVRRLGIPVGGALAVAYLLTRSGNRQDDDEATEAQDDDETSS